MNDEGSAELCHRAHVHAALGDVNRLAIVDALLHDDASPGELAAALELPTNLLAHHVTVLQQAGLVVRTRSEGDRRRTYLRLEPRVLATLGVPGSAHQPETVPRVVFVCTHNSARSQLAAALWRGRSRVPATSAGTQPAPQIHPRALRVASRHGLPLDDARPRALGDVHRADDLVVAVCDNAHERLGSTPTRHRLHWSVPDPARADTEDAFEAAYADLAGRIDRLAPAYTSDRSES